MFKKKTDEAEQVTVLPADIVHPFNAATYAGVRTHIDNKSGDNTKQVDAVWDKLASDGTLEKLRALADPEEQSFFAVASDFIGKGYDYSVCVKLASEDVETPESMELIRSESADYAVFVCEGPARSSVAEKWNYIYNQWFPRSGFNHSGGVELEVYPFGDMEGEDYKAEIRVPVRVMPPRKFTPRGSALGAFPYIAIGGLAGMLIGAGSDNILIGVIIGGGVGYFLYSYIKKRRDDREKKDDDEGEE